MTHCEMLVILFDAGERDCGREAVICIEGVPCCVKCASETLYSEPDFKISYLPTLLETPTRFERALR
jgi:hypothetical protein